MNEDDIKALSIIKKHIRHFKRSVQDGLEKISFTLFNNFDYEEDFEFMKSWIKKVEKERGWKL